MSKNKKQIRQDFRDECLWRDNYSCRGPGCSFKSSSEKAEEDLDVHHIKNRSGLPFGGYIKENGISLCERCHIKAEKSLVGNDQTGDFSVNNLYKIIGSSKEQAIKASLEIKGL